MVLTAYKYNGVAIRTADGLLAGDPACCCDQNPSACCCGTAVSGRDLRLTIASADCPEVDGIVVDLDPSPPLYGGCYAWRKTTGNIVSCTASFGAVFHVECMALTGLCTDYKIWINWTNSDCGTGSTVAATAVDAGCDCDPFALTWSNLVTPHNGPPNPSPTACDCCDSTDSMDITAEIL